jgi:TonB family protein
MIKKSKNKKSELSGFLQYSGNKMTDRERNAFERKLQKDPFAEEASEGFAEIHPEEADEDLTILRKRLETRTVRKQRFIYYRLAASVALLMVITTIFILLERNRSLKQQEKPINQSVAIANPESQPLYKPEIKSVGTEKPSAISENTEDNSTTGQIVKEAEKVVSQPEKARVEAANTVENIQASALKGAERIVSVDQVAAPADAIAARATSAGHQIKGKIFSSDDNQPIPGATVIIKGTTIGTTTDTGGNFKMTLPDAANRSLVASFIGMGSKEFQVGRDSVVKISLDPSVLALNEVVMVGYGTGREKSIDSTGAVSRIDLEKKVSENSYNPPEPVTGKADFDKYIEDNIHRPDIMEAGGRAVVVVSFDVKSNGIIDSVRIIRSPGKPFSEEAIRLIKEGPGWKPANENGERITDKVTIRIVFK